MSPDGSTKPLPPEEKLLKLIRRQEPQAGPAGPVASPAAGRPAGSAGSVGARVQTAALVKWAVGGLSLVLAVELVWFIVQVSRPPQIDPSLLEPSHPSGHAQAPSNDAPSPPEIPSLAESATRPLFLPSVGAGASSAAAARTPLGAVAKQLAARLSLMGIISGSPPQAIIEDSQTKKSYFVSPGQMVAEGAVLEQVLDNRVVLDLDGQKIEIAL